MKKTMAMIIATMMLLMATCAFGETVIHDPFEDFDFAVAIPEGYSIVQDYIEDVFVVGFVPDDEAQMGYPVAVAYTELYDGQTMTDFTEEEMALYQSLVLKNFENATVTEIINEKGTKLIVVDENVENTDFAIISSIYKGYEFFIYMVHYDNSPVTQEEIDLGVKIFTDIAFVE